VVPSSGTATPVFAKRPCRIRAAGFLAFSGRVLFVTALGLRAQGGAAQIKFLGKHTPGPHLALAETMK
jgi:hypothetical protein